MAPEMNPEATQEEMGWEDLTSTGDGRSEGFDEPEPKPEAEAGREQAAKATTGDTQERTRVAPTEPVATGTEKIGAEAGIEPAKQTWTLDGGQQVTVDDLVKNPELINQIVTRSNQAANYQRLAEERGQRAAMAEEEKRRLLDQYTEWQLQQQHAAQQAQAPPPPQRPPNTAIAGHFEPHLRQLVSDGRLTEDQKAEFGNVIAEYMYDHQSMRNLVQEVVNLGSARIQFLENQLFGDIVPDVTRRRQMDALQMDQAVQQHVASQAGYESLADQGEWNRLKLFIAQKVNASPRDAQGRPTFDPQFDPETMAQMYDAMTGANMRAQLAAQKAAQEEAAKKTRAMAGGETSARAGRPAPRQPGKLTPEEEALDFGDPRMASG